MNTSKIAQATRRHLVTYAAIGTLALSSAFLVGCGGGGGVSGSGTGATATGFSAGTVTGKGSTIVNGVRFDDKGVDVVHNEDDGTAAEDGHHLAGDDLKVGMEIEVEHGTVSCPTAGLTVANCDVTPTATATKINFGNNSLVGRIAGIQTVAGVTTFTVLGQSVTTTANTVVNLEGLAAALADGQVVEVHGKFDATNKLTATRIEVKVAAGGTIPAGLTFRLRGLLVVGTGGAATIGGTTVDLNGVSTTGLDNTVVRAKLDTASTPPKVLALKSGVRKLDGHKGEDAKLEGKIANAVVASNVATFDIGGALVQVPKSVFDLLPGATQLALAVNGTSVEVEGKVDSTGLLVASKVTLENENEAIEAELHGAITGYPVLASRTGTTRTFTLHGEAVVFDEANVSGGNKSGAIKTVAALDAAVDANANQQFEAKGTRSTDGTKVVISFIKKDN